VNVPTCLTSCYPEDIYASLGIRLEWAARGDLNVELLISDEWGRTSSHLLTEKFLFSARGAEVQARIEGAVEWHLEPPPFYVP
jgi:hypothetical protein